MYIGKCVEKTLDKLGNSKKFLGKSFNKLREIEGEPWENMEIILGKFC
jgi:hypothetical protein